MNEILIYVPKITNRVRYVFRLVFKELLKVRYRLTKDLDAFQSANQPKMMYGLKAHTDDLFFQSWGLLFERGIRSLDYNPLVYKGDKAFFPVYAEEAAMPFDVFSAIFFLVTRYEEYLPFVKDKHDRFTAHLSLSNQLGILQKPMVNIWVQEIKRMISERYPDFIFPQKRFRFIPTYDIDMAWSYKNKGVLRNLGGYYRSLSHLDFAEMKQRTKVLLGKEKDPFDTYELQMRYKEAYKLHPIYFILFGQYGPFDKNLNPRNRKFRLLIKWLADYAKIGIHPSYASGDHPEFLKEELFFLEDLLKKDIHRSRQHYLRFTLPDTFQNLLEYDITDDYSMGYASLPGFRAGICDTYRFYDLLLEVETKLRIHPFAVMDGTLKDYMHLTTADAITQIKELVDEVKKVNGTFISLWHNESLSNQKRWKGWQQVYESMLDMTRV